MSPLKNIILGIILIAIFGLTILLDGFNETSLLCLQVVFLVIGILGFIFLLAGIIFLKQVRGFIKKCKNYIGEILIVLGSCITVYNIFDWMGTSKRWAKDEIIPWIVVGIALLVSGILIIRRRKRKEINL